MKRVTFERVLEKVSAGTCSEDEFLLFSEALRGSSEFRRLYRESAILDQMLSELSRSERFGRALSISDVLIRRRRRRAVASSLGLAAAVLMVGAVLLHFLHLEQPQELRLAAAPNTEWEVLAEDGAPRDPSRLRAGDRVFVRAGTVELVCGDGVSGIVQGPARFELSKLGVLDLSYGTGRFEVPSGAEGFTVRTRRMEVVDLGTSFGIMSPESIDIREEVHVFEGRVRVRATSGAQESRELVAGEAVSLEGLGKLEKIQLDGSAFYTSLPDDLPYIHLGFDGRAGKGFRVSGTHPAVPSIRAEIEGEVKEVVGASGRAVAFGKRGSRVATNWQGPIGSAPRTISAWVRIPEDGSARTYQTVVGWGDSQIGYAGKTELLLFQSRPGDPVRARLSFDQFLFTGSSDLADGKWHHIAAVYDPFISKEVRERVKLYIDGEPEALNRRFTRVPDLPREPLTREGGHPLVVGELNNNSPAYERTLQGEVDEVHVFEAALDEARIRKLAEKP